MRMFVSWLTLLMRRLRHLLVLFFAFFVDGGNALTPFLRKMPQEAHDAPHLVIVKLAVPAGHAAEANAVLDNPFQLSIGVLLNVFIA